VAVLDLYAYGTDEEWERQEDEDWSEYWERTSQTLQAMTEKGLESKTLSGYVWRWPVADGYAVYVVTKLRPLTLTWVNVGDGYAVPDAHIRGLTKADLEAQKEFDLKWREMTAKTKKEAGL
jgi:hypothetical protein